MTDFPGFLLINKKIAFIILVIFLSMYLKKVIDAWFLLLNQMQNLNMPVIQMKNKTFLVSNSHAF